tara:strand:- start:4338 stop:4994 length:657 start_codon:yes stop_codon:yes gene_type:complete
MLLVLLLSFPNKKIRRKLTSLAAKSFLFFSGTSMKIINKSYLIDSPCVVVANHSSYLDGIILKAALPAKFTFLIKEEMSKVPLIGLMLRLIGSEFVKRENPVEKNRAIRHLYKSANSGKSLAVFPEGTFSPEPGLKKFHSGAFAAAKKANIPVIPIAITGARKKLPASVWLPKIGTICVNFCQIIQTKDFDSAKDIAKYSRNLILEKLDEPDLLEEKK